MAVYVDGLMACVPIRMWQWTEVCHLFADREDELHGFAKMLGLKREWFREGSGLKHYDLTARMRMSALMHGAREVDKRFVVEFMVRGAREDQQLSLF
jgi:hypothetical protein